MQNYRVIKTNQQTNKLPGSLQAKKKKKRKKRKGQRHLVPLGHLPTEKRPTGTQGEGGGGLTPA